MRRNLLQDLARWKTSSARMPLLLRGARQVGKSYLVEAFGKEFFENIVKVNFEFQPHLKACFDTLDPTEITKKITLLSKQSITPRKTLLFLDEIQECPEAIQALRYFKENMPELHVIGAGSLLEFALNDSEFRMPVGRVQFLFLKPLSFYEYLIATDRAQWVEHLKQVTIKEGVFSALHNDLLKALKEYLITGGMPAVINTYLKTNDFKLCQEQQAAILEAYRSDFGKYAKQTAHKNMQLLFDKAPGLLGQQIKYSKISQDISSRDLKVALDYLVKAGLISPVYHSAASGLPFSTEKNEKKFKLVFLDTGLAQHTSRLSADIMLTDDILLLNRGAIAEQFVGQELLANSPTYEPSHLYYWQSDKKSSSAELDYVTHVGSQIIPIKVKSGATGSLKSMLLFLQAKQLPLGVKISQQPLRLDENVLSIPLYMIAEIERLAKSIKTNIEF